ncbi:MAG: histone deacetylase, partial [Bacteroidota bacterium]
NYPLRKEQSDLDIGLPDKTKGDAYLKVLESTLPKLIKDHQPDLVFYLSGVDVLESDRLGRLSLSVQACKERDRFVFNACKAPNIPVAVSMGGGYSKKIANIIEGHANTYRVAIDIFD